MSSDVSHLKKGIFWPWQEPHEPPDAASAMHLIIAQTQDQE